MIYTPYYDTLRLGTCTEALSQFLFDPLFWRRKYLTEKTAGSASDTIKVTNWHQLYLLTTDKVGGNIETEGFILPDYIINIFLKQEDVWWILTSEGIIASLLYRDPERAWKQSNIPSEGVFSESVSVRVKFIRPCDKGGYKALAVTDRNELYLLGAAGGSVTLIQLPGDLNFGDIVDVYWSQQEDNKFKVLYSSGTVIRYRNDNSEIIRGKETRNIILILEGHVIKSVEESKGEIRFYTKHNKYYTDEDFPLKTEYLIDPPAPRKQELPLTPVLARTLDTSGVFREFDSSIGAFFDVETQHDIVSEFQNTDRGILDTGMDTT